MTYRFAPSINELLELPNIQSKLLEYVKLRNDIDPLWDEQYKWDILPRANKDFAQGDISLENVLEKAKLLQKYNPTRGSFVHWADPSSIVNLAKKNPRRAVVFFKTLFDPTQPLAERIDKCYEEFDELQVGTPGFGYFLAVYDYHRYPLYKDSVLKSFQKVYGFTDWAKFSIGEKYQVFAELCDAFGRYLNRENQLKAIEVDGIVVEPGLIPVDGQDFLYTQFERDALRDPSYWQIAPGEQARLWKDFVDEGIVCVGWEEAGDLSEIESQDSLMKHLKKSYPAWSQNRIAANTALLWKFLSLRPRDFVVANRGRREIIGLGQVIGDYEYDTSREEYRHTIRVNWFDTSRRPVPSSLSGRFGTTISKLSKEEFEAIKDSFTLSLDGLLLLKKHQIVYYGPPGTGKTFQARQLAIEVLRVSK